MEDKIVVRAEVGDIVVAKGQYDFLGKTHIDVGQEWTVTDKFGLFVKIKREDDSFWLGDINFIEIFESDK